MTTPPKDPPEGCQEIPGFSIDFFEGSAWLTKDGQITNEWSKRGVWSTEEEAREAYEKVLKELAE